VVLAVCPGSFDPFTLGHLDVVRRASRLADEVVVLVAHNSAKRPLLAPQTRVALIEGLLADQLRDLGATMVVKGLRGGADFDGELPMALMNRHLSGVETVFVVGDPALSHVASSLVKDVARHGGPIDDLVPPGIAAAVHAALADERSTR
jgi:pantetheine-phosphate adenylyltransferase